MPDLDLKNHPEILELYKTNPIEAVKQAAEIQSAPTVDKLKLMIDKQAADGKVKMAAIDNYRGPDGKYADGTEFVGIPYLSDAQIEHLQAYGMKDGKNVEFFVNSGSVKDATKKSGYTALQLNFEHEDGSFSEWQTRGHSVNEFAGREHPLYKIRQGADLTAGRAELKEAYAPITEAINNLSDAEYKEHTTFLNHQNLYLRKSELGFDVTAPVLDEKFNPILNAEGLEKSHDDVEAAKKLIK